MEEILYAIRRILRGVSGLSGKERPYNILYGKYCEEADEKLEKASSAIFLRMISQVPKLQELLEACERSRQAAKRRWEREMKVGGGSRDLKESDRISLGMRKKYVDFMKDFEWMFPRNSIQRYVLAAELNLLDCSPEYVARSKNPFGVGTWKKYMHRQGKMLGLDAYIGEVNFDYSRYGWIFFVYGRKSFLANIFFVHFFKYLAPDSFKEVVEKNEEEYASIKRYLQRWGRVQNVQEQLKQVLDEANKLSDLLS